MENEIKVEEIKKSIDYWESEVKRNLDKGDVMSATMCRILANNLRKDIGLPENL